MSYCLKWNDLRSLDDLEKVIDNTSTKPALVFNHRYTSEESSKAKETLEKNWGISDDQLDCYIVDAMKDKLIATEVSDFAGIPNTFPQIILFADGVAMYDEANEMINVKKIKIALKIINRTFKWMETRA